MIPTPTPTPQSEKPGPRTRPRDAFTRLLAERLRAYRTASKLSQEAVGRLFDPPISRAAVAQWEDPDAGTTPDLSRLLILARAYQVSMDDLLGARPSTPAETMVHGKGPFASGTALPAAARALAIAWLKLPVAKQRFYEKAIRIDSAMADAFPELQDSLADAMVAVNPDYHMLTQALIESRQQLARRPKAVNKP